MAHLAAVILTAAERVGDRVDDDKAGAERPRLMRQLGKGRCQRRQSPSEGHQEVVVSKTWHPSDRREVREAAGIGGVDVGLATMQLLGRGLAGKRERSTWPAGHAEPFRAYRCRREQLLSEQRFADA